MPPDITHVHKLLLNSYYGKGQTMPDNKDIDIDYYAEIKSKKKRIRAMVRDLNSYRRATRTRLEQLAMKDRQLREVTYQLETAKGALYNIHMAMLPVQKADQYNSVNIKPEFRPNGR